uniref:Coiled-coil domain containing 59 n=1 Tax=Naja naja TaxID=35670 RepID=A0A8C6XRW3_NAJNA
PLPVRSLLSTGLLVPSQGVHFVTSSSLPDTDWYSNRISVHNIRLASQGFAIWRKQKIQRAYKKLLKKERHVNPQKNVGYTEVYPEHLKHLYLAEEEMLQKQQKPKHKPIVLEEKETQTSDNVIQRKHKAKTSNQKAKEDYEKIKTERNEKKEVSKRRREEREKAQKLYKQKKMETYKILSKRTRKGQPNLNLQMEYLLQKIEQKA